MLKKTKEKKNPLLTRKPVLGRVSNYSYSGIGPKECALSIFNTVEFCGM